MAGEGRNSRPDGRKRRAQTLPDYDSITVIIVNRLRKGRICNGLRAARWGKKKDLAQGATEACLRQA